MRRAEPKPERTVAGKDIQRELDSRPGIRDSLVEAVWKRLNHVGFRK